MMRETFIVNIISSQNSSWQGTVDWAEGRRRQAFRSEMELIRLMDSALSEQRAQKEPETPEEMA